MTTNLLGLNKPASQTKVCVEMSGGVDSSAAAAMLKEQGFDVFGLTMDLLQAPIGRASVRERVCQCV